MSSSRPVVSVRARRGVSGRLRLVGTIVRPVHVGSASWKLRGAGVLLSQVAYGDDYVIPASAIRGAVREKFARLTDSCAGFPPNKCTPDRRCAACHVVGTRGYRGRLWVSDALLVEGRVDAVAVSQSAERWLEAITEGEVEWEILLDGVDPVLVRPLCEALGLSDGAPVAVGEPHADGRGAIRFRAVEIESPRGLAGGAGLGEVVQASVDAWIRAVGVEAMA